MIVLSYIVDSHACVNVIHIIKAILDACVYTISSVHFNSDTENSLCRSVHFWFVFVSFPFVYNLLLFRGGCCLVEVSRFITTAIFFIFTSHFSRAGEWNGIPQRTCRPSIIAQPFKTYENDRYRVPGSHFHIHHGLSWDCCVLYRIQSIFVHKRGEDRPC